jgi:glycosyltransferase involved in cell wall biosynthesis
VKILQFNNYADPVGGAEVYALALTRELSARGHTVGFFGTAPDREVDDELLRVVRRPRYDAGTLYRDPLVRDALAGYVRRLRPDLIHVHNVFSIGLDVLELLGSTGVPTVQTVHDFSLLCPNSWCVRGDGAPCAGGAGVQCFQHECHKNYPYDPEVVLSTLLKHRTLAGVIDLMVCPSRHLADLMRASGAREVRHLNYFIDAIESGAPAPRKDKELVFIGRLEPEKGVEYLLEAMVPILAADPEVKLTIVGGGSLAGALASRAEGLHLGRAVTFLSHVPRAELGRFYATATACVLPSIWSENSPLVAYECLAAGLPMIASRIGGIPELAEDGRAGFTFTPRDARDLASKTLNLLALPAAERERMSDTMRARARDFRTTAHVDRILEIYGELLARPRERTPVAVPLDLDLLTVLGRFGEEKNRLGAYFREHVAYIRSLEASLASRTSAGTSTEPGRPNGPAEAPAGAPEPRPPVHEEAREILQRLAKALNLPKVFKR